MKDENIKNNTETSQDSVSKTVDAMSVSEDVVASALDGTASYTNDALADELEQLAATFRAELKKAQGMSEKELAANGYIEGSEEQPTVDPTEICECCGERLKDKTLNESSAYCKECRDAMRKYPLSIPNMVLAVAVIFVSIVSVLSFAADFAKYNTIREADKYYNANKLDSALSAYEGAISAFEDEDVVAKRLYLDVADILYKTMPQGVNSMSQLVTSIDSALSKTEKKLPIYQSYGNLREEILILYGTMQKFYDVVNQEKYVNFDPKNQKLYEEAMTEIGSIIDAKLTITSSDGKKSYNVASNEAIVRFCQYMFAYTAEQYDDSYMYMQKVAELEPDYLWLYAYELGSVHLQNGKVEEATALAKALYQNNYEADDAYALYSSVYRMSGKVNKAVEWADKGVKVNPESAELYRIKAMAHVAKGEFEKAKEAVDKGVSIDQYGLIYFTAIVIENELGNTETVEEYKDILAEQEIELTDKMNDYFKGKITANQMFTEGTGDVQ